jgi:hypothetical protein
MLTWGSAPKHATGHSSPCVRSPCHAVPSCGFSARVLRRHVWPPLACQSTASDQVARRPQRSHGSCALLRLRLTSFSCVELCQLLPLCNPASPCVPPDVPLGCPNSPQDPSGLLRNKCCDRVLAACRLLDTLFRGSAAAGNAAASLLLLGPVELEPGGRALAVLALMKLASTDPVRRLRRAGGGRAGRRADCPGRSTGAAGIQPDALCCWDPVVGLACCRAVL